MPSAHTESRKRQKEQNPTEESSPKKPKQFQTHAPITIDEEEDSGLVLIETTRSPTLHEESKEDQTEFANEIPEESNQIEQSADNEITDVQVEQRPITSVSNGSRYSSVSDICAIDATTRPNEESMRIFWQYIYQRQVIWQKRSRDDPPPWSDDIILQRHQFTNVYRELDAGTAYLKANLHSKKDFALFQCILYRLINRIETFERWPDHCLPRPKNIDAFILWCKREMSLGSNGRTFLGSLYPR